MVIRLKNFSDQILEHNSVLNDLINLEESLLEICEMVLESIKSGGTVFFCGNGGSAADAQHLATELVVRFETNRRAIAALALTVDTSALTAIGNDFSFDQLFARQLQALGRKDDVLIAISTSGNSKNVIHATEMANQLDMKTVGLLGKGGGPLKNFCDKSLIVPSDRTARIQEAHLFLGHFICGYVECNIDIEK